MTIKPRVKWDFTHPNAMASPVKDLSGNNMHLSINTIYETANGPDGTLLDPTKKAYLYRTRNGGLTVIPDDGNPFYIQIKFIPYKYGNTMYLINTGMESGSYKMGNLTYINITIDPTGVLRYNNTIMGSMVAINLASTNMVNYNTMNTLIINDVCKKDSEVELILNGIVTKGVRKSDATTSTGEFEQSQFLVGTSQPKYTARYSGYIKSIETGSGKMPFQKFLLQSEDKLYYINSDGNISECGSVNDPNILQYFEKYGNSSLPDLYKLIQSKLDKPYKIVMMDYKKE